MKRPVCLLFMLLACSPDPSLPRELRDSGLDATPAVLTSAAVVLFWLPAVDSLSADSTAFAVELMGENADDLRDLLSDTDIEVLVTTRTRIYVETPGHRGSRRIVSLAGLDYPWGVVLVEPGYAEQIITGPVPPADLRELVWDYFGLEEEKPSGPIAQNSNFKVPSADQQLKRRTARTFSFATRQSALFR